MAKEKDTAAKDILDDLFKTTDALNIDDTDEVLETPLLHIDLNEIDSESKQIANNITERLSNYYFDEQYLVNHPYIPNKIMQEMNNIRRLLKMLAVNEKAQDALISNISMNAGKGSLYAALTALQNSMLNIQTQLNRLTESLENIFKNMQAECEKTFDQKDKERDSEDGSMVVRGSKEFIKSLNNRLYGNDVGSGEITQLDLFEQEDTGQDIENDEFIGGVLAEDINNFK